MITRITYNIIQQRLDVIRYRVKDGFEKPERIPRYLLRQLLLTVWKWGSLSYHDIVATEERREYLRETDQQIVSTYARPERVDIEPPETECEMPDELSQELGVIEFEEAFVYRLSEAELLGLQPLIRTNDGRVMIDCLAGRPSLLRRAEVDWLMQRVRTRGRAVHRAKYESLFLLTGPFSEAYAHWFHDYLPRLAGFDQLRQRGHANLKLLIQANPPDWMVQSLRALGYQSSDLVEWRGGSAVVDELYVATGRWARNQTGGTVGTHVHSTGYEYRHRIIEACVNKDESMEGPNVLFISREDARTRRIINRDALIDALHAYDPTVESMSELPFEEQVSASHDADVILASHGAGLTNCLWSTEGDVIEIFGNHMTAHQLSVTRNINLRYHPIVGVPVGRDIWVNPDNVREIVNLISQNNDL